ncbi:hypothetical protein Tco_1001471 [Tanacetum coccineum]
MQTGNGLQRSLRHDYYVVETMFHIVTKKELAPDQLYRKALQFIVYFSTRIKFGILNLAILITENNKRISFLTSVPLSLQEKSWYPQRAKKKDMTRAAASAGGAEKKK